MKDADLKAIRDFDPSKNVYLVMSGHGKDKHIEARELKALKIPFLGRILKLIGYPSLRFRSVVNYLLNPENGMDQMDAPSKALIRGKIQHYFGLDANNQAHQHLKLWEKLNPSYLNIFPVGKVLPQEQERPQREISIFYQYDYEKKNPKKIYQLKDDVLQALPPQENYIVTTTFENGRPNGSSGIGDLDCGLLANLKLHLEEQKFDKPPVILILLFPGTLFLQRLVEDNLKALEELKKLGLIRGYCALDSDYPLSGNKQYPAYRNIKEINMAAVESLKASLAN